jgi:hypothetical protein
MPTPIRYPDTTSFRADFHSSIAKIDGQQFPGYKECKLSRKRERGVVKGANADPLGKTRGSNTYEASITVFAAEFKIFVLDHFGAGYADKTFTFEVALTEGGYDTQVHYALGCTIDSSELSISEGNDAVTLTIDMSPVKILFNGTDDNAAPLAGAPSIG